ncbi:MAG: SAM-dependent methyltransferase, partial [Microthrixaceae bacterium]
AGGWVGRGLGDVRARFCFVGCRPRRGAPRRERLDALRGEGRTVVIYEAPHRLARTVADLGSTLGGERRVALCRELTKLHEETWRGTLAEAGEHLDLHPPRGEYVVVLDGAADELPLGDELLVDDLRRRLDAGATRRDAAAAVAEQHGVAPNRVKRLAQELGDAER